MSKVQTFFTTLFRSLTSAPYYRDVVAARFSFSFKYVLFFYLFVTLITLAPVFHMLFAFDAGRAIRQAGSAYPADLTMTIANGQFFINKPLPYVIPLPQDLAEAGKESTYTSLIVFEKDSAIRSIADVRDRHTFILVTESSFYMIKDTQTGEIRAYPIPRTEHAITISRAMVDSVLTRVAEYPLIKSRLYAPVLSVLLYLVTYPFAVLGAMISLLVISLLPFALSRLFIKHAVFSYTGVLQVAMHAHTGLVLLNLLTARLMGMQLLPGLLYTVVLTLVVLGLLAQLPKKSASHSTHRKRSR